MLYHYLKILHILSASLLLTSIGYSLWLWHQNRGNLDTASNKIQLQTWMLIAPFAVFQLATGFTMISVQHENLSALWIKYSVIGFLLLISSWFAFVYFLLSEQFSTKPGFFYRLQCTAITVGSLALLSMIFFMSTKII